MVNKLATKWLDANEIKTTLSIEMVLERYGALASMHRSGDTLRGLSPFRDERVPSFSVNLIRNIWNDHPRPVIDGETVKGNVIGLIQAFEQCSFRSALETAYEITGIEPRNPPTSGPSKARRETKSRVEKALSDEVAPTNEVFGRSLKLKYDHPYLVSRGLPVKRARYWGVGWVPRGILRGRIGVPIRNRGGDTVAYMGRALKDDDADGKWRFPKGFQKRLELFNVERIAGDEQTQRAVAEHGIIVTEGCFDAIWLSEHGFKNVVATMGADASDEQCQMLVDRTLNPTGRVTIFFDADEAGRRGRKELCGKLIFDAFVRYVDVGRVDADGRTDPDHFSKEELWALFE